MLHASVLHTGHAAWAGLVVLLAGVPMLFCKDSTAPCEAPVLTSSHSPGDPP